MIPLSVLDLVPVRAGVPAAVAIREVTELARAAERLGYRRYWFAEHHGVGSFASSAPEILIGHVAGATSKIRVGAGGILLNNHPPLRVAEVFRTLEALYPGRIDLGLGRTHGGDRVTPRALRAFPSEAFESQLRELLGLCARSLSADHPLASVRVVPDDVALPPIWVLGSTGGTAALAGSLGLGYAYARHLRGSSGPALAQYREAFRPSSAFADARGIVSVSAICAPTEEEATALAGPGDVAHWQRTRGEFAPLPTPSEAAPFLTEPEATATLAESRRRHFVGTPASVVASVRALVRDLGADEVMITTMVHDPVARLRSYELFAEAWGCAECPSVNARSTVQRSPGAYTADLGEGTVLMNVESGEYFKMDRIALDIWNRIESPIEVGKLCRDLAEAYRGDPAVIEREAVALLAGFEKNNLLECTGS